MRGVGTILLAVQVAACGGAAPLGPAAPAAAGRPLSGTVTVLAAASLTDAFNVLGTEFTRVNPQVTVKASYAASSALVAQIVQGAEADVFASADEPSMRRLVDARLSESSPRIIASNKLQIAVGAGNPKKISALADLARPDVVVVLGAPTVPVGAYATQVFDKAGVRVAPKSHEADVKAVVSKVSLGEADAGIVYGTDVRAGGAKVQGVDIPDQHNVIARYPIAAVKGSKNAKAAAAFIDFVASPRGLDVIAGFGFLRP
ncbi:MAG: molybdate ABC transporter substrate-binding protein [Chloroflexi bacterium]|nr:molybdate ABC transporter substrate-binding protein [Chloroflexota bacterium]